MRYLYQYFSFSKTADQCSQAIKKAVKEAFESNICHHDAMKTIAKAYLKNQVFTTVGSKEDLSSCLVC